MAEFDIGDRFRPREQLLDNPALADKMVRRSISRREIDGILTDNEIIEVYEYDDRVRYVSWGTSTSGRCTWSSAKTTSSTPPS